MENNKQVIREEVNKIIAEYDGEDMSQLLMIIKERIEKRIGNGDKEV